ncbi:MAG: hypothetical protein MUP81_02670 [Dehalococcoidia bacterium]|nr:hypothetical protein [Dehalococcoidia bacterium]
MAHTPKNNPRIGITYYVNKEVNNEAIPEVYEGKETASASPEESKSSTAEEDFTPQTLWDEGITPEEIWDEGTSTEEEIVQKPPESEIAIM